jgi:type II secretory pathway component PulK
MNKPSIITKNEKGIALLLVLWLITLFAVICAEFSSTMHTETVIVRNYKDGEQAYYTAEAGINRTIIELERASKSIRQNFFAEDEDEEEPEFVYWEPGGGPYVFNIDDYICEVKIEDENNRLGLNAFLKKAKTNPSLLKSLLDNKVGLEGEERDIVADSLIDWWDKDHNITGINGAENDYYESLEEPYKCRNGEIPVIEELLMVRGIDEIIFYGTAKNPGQKVMITREELEAFLEGTMENQEEIEAEVQYEGDNDTKINLGLCNIFSTFSTATSLTLDINTASFEELLILEGMDPETSNEIITERNEDLFESTTDRLPQFKNYEVWRGNIVVDDSKSTKNYKVTATGFSADRQISRTISCNMKLERKQYTISNWKTIN